MFSSHNELTSSCVRLLPPKSQIFTAPLWSQETSSPWFGCMTQSFTGDLWSKFRWGDFGIRGSHIFNVPSSEAVTNHLASDCHATAVTFPECESNEAAWNKGDRWEDRGEDSIDHQVNPIECINMISRQHKSPTGAILPPGCIGCVRSYILIDWLPAAAINRLSGLIAIRFNCYIETRTIAKVSQVRFEWPVN